MIKALRKFRVRVLWFFRNYKKIEFHSTLITDELTGPVRYISDGVITCNNTAFLEQARFKQAYALAKATQPWPGFKSEWRVMINCWIAEQAMRIEGDFVECGVNTGAYSRAIIDYTHLTSSTKRFYLFDTWEGLVDAQISAEERKKGIQNYDYKNIYEKVQKTFEGLPAVLIKGSVPETLDQFKGEKVAYLSLDMNVTLPEIAALEFFWPKLSSGAFIVLDDYGFMLHEEQKKAMDQFAAKMKVEILPLPTGQALMMKP